MSEKKWSVETRDHGNDGRVTDQGYKTDKFKSILTKIKKKLQTASGVSALRKKFLAIGCNDATWGKIVKFLGGACFPAKTPIYTIHGLKPIELITVKDTVYSYDESTRKYVLNKVKQTFKKTTTKLVMLYTLGGKLVASPTPEHPFFVKGTYKPAKELVKGDSLLSKNLGYIVVDEAIVIDSVVEVYNFEVEDNHNYLVGNEGILVHNTCNPDAAYIESKYPTFARLKPGAYRRTPILNSEEYDFYISATKKNGATFKINYDKSHLPDLRSFTYRFNGKPMAFKSSNNAFYAADNSIDFPNANTWLSGQGIPGLTINSSKNPVINGITYTWHHHQDGKTLMLVEQEVHAASLPHVGKEFLLSWIHEFTFDSPF